MARQSLIGPVIEAGASMSDPLDCCGGRIISITTPASWTGANLSFVVSSDGQNYTDLFDAHAREIAIPVVPGVTMSLASIHDDLLSAAYLKLRSGTRDYPVTQEARREFGVTIDAEAGGGDLTVTGSFSAQNGADILGDLTVTDGMLHVVNGLIAVDGSAEISAQGIRYTGLGGNHKIGYTWDSTAICVWVDGAQVGRVATGEYLSANGGTVEGNLNVNGIMDVGPAGILAVEGQAKIGDTGIQYPGIGDGNRIAFSWDGSRVHVWVNGTDRGLLTVG